ncbi:hypothetical protein PSTT_04788, partial [Puccinia striiformis]
TRREELEAFFANRARPTGPRSLPDTNQPIERQGRPVEDPPQPVDNNDRPVGNHREPTNRPGTALDSTGAAASALPSTTDVASLFANAFRPTGITARPEHTPFIDPDIANNEPRLVLDPALTALLRIIYRSVDRSVTTRSGNSTLAVQQQLTTGNLRSLDPTINRRENSIEEIPEEQRSVEIITDPPNQRSLARENLNAAEARRNFTPQTNSPSVPGTILDGASDNNMEAMVMLRAQAIRSHRTLEESIGLQVLLTCRGVEPFSVDYRTRQEKLAIVVNKNVDKIVPRRIRRREEIAHQLSEFPGPTTSEYRRDARSKSETTRQQYPHEGALGYRSSIFEELFGGTNVPGGLSSDRSSPPTQPRELRPGSSLNDTLTIKTARDILNLCLTISNVVDDDAKLLLVNLLLLSAVVAANCKMFLLPFLTRYSSAGYSPIELQVYLDDLSSSSLGLLKLFALRLQKRVSEILSTSESRVMQSLTESQDSFLAQLLSCSEHDSDKLIQAVQELHAKVHRIEALIEALPESRAFSVATPLPTVCSTGFDSAAIQTIVENTMSKYMARFESVLAANIDQLSSKAPSETPNQDELEQKLEDHSEGAETRLLQAER